MTVAWITVCSAASCQASPLQRQSAGERGRGPSMIRGCICAGLLLFAALMSPVFAEKRVALVVGNSAYPYVPRLTNPANDARLLSETLRSLGFTLVGGG